MEKILDVLGVIECGGLSRGFRCFLFVARFSWVNACDRIKQGKEHGFTKLTFEDAQPSEVGERDLKFAHSLSSSNKILGLARSSYENVLAL